VQAPRGGWELVLVDNGSTDDTRAVISGFAPTAPCPVVVVSEPVAGLSRGRNAGLRVARGDVIAFTDDDCYVAPDFLAQIEVVFATHEIGYYGGRVLLHDPSDDAITTQTRPHAVVLEPTSFITPGFIHGANMAVRREVVDAIGGFDVGLGPGTPLYAADDTEFLGRASAGGWRGAYDPRPVVYHHHRRKAGRDTQLLMKKYDYARGGYYASCLLEPRLRAPCLRHIVHELKQRVRRTDFGSIVRELTGAIRFLAYRATHVDSIPSLRDSPAR
jgi:glycosyltransferase involved in cell wall biosynthesis